MAHRSIAAALTDRPSPPLVLASEALREDLAPFEPGDPVGRLIIGGVAASLGLLGLAMWLGAAPAAAEHTATSWTFAAAGAAAALAAVPLPYAARAIAITILGAAVMVLGSGGAGPLAAAWPPPRSGLEWSRLLALAALPGALLFRARYRAYPRARVVLGIALLVAAPFAVSRGLVLADSGAMLSDRACAAVDVGVILSGLFGFMGADTTGGGAVWAALALGILTADVVLRDLDDPAGPSRLLVRAVAAIGTVCGAALLCTGEYHILAARLARDARRDARRKDSEANSSLNPG